MASLTLTSQNDILHYAKEILEIEASAIANVSKQLDKNFYEAVRLILNCQGMTVLAGVGKAGLIGEKISATLASVGIPSITIHPTDALHGDLGRVRPGDILVVLSNSGETDEVKSLLTALKKFAVKIIAITSEESSSIAQAADLSINLGKIMEACPLGLAPTASTSAMMAVGDALAMTIVKARNFTQADFAKYHPKGNLGFKLTPIKEVMRTGEKLPLTTAESSVKTVLVTMTTTLGRPGAALVVDPQNNLLGIFTDGDIRRLLKEGNMDFLNRPISQFMHANPKTIHEDQSIEEAANLLRTYGIDQLPVVNTQNQIVGLLDVQDII